MINKILYTNLDRRPDRNEWFRENMESAGVPMNLVERIPARDWKDYPNVQSQLEDMKLDGFGLNIDPTDPTVDHPKNRGSYAFMWSYCTALRKSVNTDFVLVMQDDVSLNVEWTALLDAVEHVVNSVYALWVIQLESTGFSPDRHHTLRPIITEDPRWRSGIGSLGEKAVVYHSWGSRLLMNMIQGTKNFLSPGEQALYHFFNNRHAVHAVDSNYFVKHNPSRGPSDIDYSMNPAMLNDDFKNKLDSA